MAKKPQELVKAYAARTDSDLYAFMGAIFYSTTSEFISLICKKQNRRKNCTLFLATPGGDPDAAYRVMRMLRSVYKEVYVVVVGQCKSAGTLMAIGANKLICGQSAEFGPLDIQIRKPDDIFNQSSGLDIFQALSITTANAFEAFEKLMVKLAVDTAGGISTKTAAELASQMSIGLYQPIMAQIDPHRLGEIHRAIAIVKSYAVRLHTGLNSLRTGAMDKLVSDFPSHTFVIDLEEAKTLFRYLVEITDDAEAIAALLGPDIRHYGPNTGSFYCDFEHKFGSPQGEQNAKDNSSNAPRGKRNLPKAAGQRKRAGTSTQPRARKFSKPRGTNAAPRAKAAVAAKVAKPPLKVISSR